MLCCPSLIGFRTCAACLLRTFHLLPLKTLIPGGSVVWTSSFCTCSWGLRHWRISFSQCLLGAVENLQVPCMRKACLTSRYSQPYFWLSTRSRLAMSQSWSHVFSWWIEKKSDYVCIWLLQNKHRLGYDSRLELLPRISQWGCWRHGSAVVLLSRISYMYIPEIT